MTSFETIAYVVDDRLAGEAVAQHFAREERRNRAGTIAMAAPRRAEDPVGIARRIGARAVVVDSDQHAAVSLHRRDAADEGGVLVIVGNDPERAWPARMKALNDPGAPDVVDVRDVGAKPGEQAWVDSRQIVVAVAQARCRRAGEAGGRLGGRGDEPRAGGARCEGQRARDGRECAQRAQAGTGGSA